MQKIKNDIHLVFDKMSKSNVKISLPPQTTARYRSQRKHLKTQFKSPLKPIHTSLSHMKPKQVFTEKKSSLNRKAQQSIQRLFTFTHQKKKKSLDEPEQPVRRERSRTFSERKAGLKKRFTLDPEAEFQKELQKIKACVQQESIFQRLSYLAVSSTKNNLRIYKQTFTKYFVERYGKDRITGFLDFQYIEDDESIPKMIEMLLKMKREELYLFVFLIIDQNKDGLISASDLIEILGIKNTASRRNQLIEKDVFKITQYINNEKKAGRTVLDRVADEIVLEEGLTIMKFRMYKFREKKLKNKESKVKQSKLGMYDLHKSLFTLKKEEQQHSGKTEKFNASTIQSILQFLKAKNEGTAEFGKKQNFFINFERFMKIFDNEIPLIFIDFLFILGGVTLDKYEYLSLSYSWLFENILKIKPVVQEESRMKKCMRRLSQMREFKTQLTIFKPK